MQLALLNMTPRSQREKRTQQHAHVVFDDASRVRAAAAAAVAAAAAATSAASAAAVAACVPLMPARATFKRLRFHAFFFCAMILFARVHDNAFFAVTITRAQVRGGVCGFIRQLHAQEQQRGQGCVRTRAEGDGLLLKRDACVCAATALIDACFVCVCVCVVVYVSVLLCACLYACMRLCVFASACPTHTPLHSPCRSVFSPALVAASYIESCPRCQYTLTPNL
jgi:hypothetical protein